MLCVHIVSSGGGSSGGGDRSSSSCSCCCCRHARPSWRRVAALLLGGLALMQLLSEVLYAAHNAGSVGDRAHASMMAQGHHAAAGHGGHSGHGVDHAGGAAHVGAGKDLGAAVPFCEGSPMVMGSMRGFNRRACVTLFFEEWELTAWWRCAC
jgi:hypothetical protein